MFPPQFILVFLVVVFSIQRNYCQSGLPDPTFGIDGYIEHSTPGSIQQVGTKILSDGKILVFGNCSFDATKTDLFLARFHEDGSIDASYGTGGSTVLDISGEDDAISDCLLLPDDEVMVVGQIFQTSEYDMLLAKFKSSGQVDSSFGVDGIVTLDFLIHDRVYNISLYNDSLLLIAGNVEDTQIDMALLRLKLDGSIDSSFGTDGLVTFDYGTHESLTEIAIQPDGKILVGGALHLFGTGPHDIFIARLHADGSLDNSWSDDGWRFLHFEGIDEQVSLRILDDQKVLVIGIADYFGPWGNDIGIARLNPDGNLDSTFAIDGKTILNIGETDATSGAHVLSDGRFLISGMATVLDLPAFSNVYQFFLACFLPDGSLDTGFGDGGIVINNYDTAGTTSYAYSSQFLESGKILAAGINRDSIGDDNRIILARFSGHGQGLYSPGWVGVNSSIQLDVFPNPTNSRFTVAFKLDEPQALSLAVYSLQGTVFEVFTNKRIFSVGSHSLEIQLPPGLPSGTYVVTLANGIHSASTILQYQAH